MRSIELLVVKVENKINLNRVIWFGYIWEKIIEKINDNAYKLELPPEFEVSPTFNIADLKPYLGEEDEIESRMTSFQEGEDDEDITPSDAPADPPTNMQGPMTRARMRQLNLEVSSFLSDPFYIIENRLLPNDVIFLRNIWEAHEEVGGSNGGKDDQQGRPTEAEGPVQHEFESTLASRTSLE
jgi:hypothetical protein